MTVADLIEKLRGMPQDAHVLVRGPSGNEAATEVTGDTCTLYPAKPGFPGTVAAVMQSGREGISAKVVKIT
jgi:hypothetical protein